MTFVPCDLCAEFPDKVRVITGLDWRSYGGSTHFHGKVQTVKCFEDNTRVKELLATPGQGQVLVVDGGGSLRHALLGDLIAADAVKNGWSGVIINGACRDVDALAKLDLGIRALGCVPIKSVRRGEGQLNITVIIGGLPIKPGDHLYADNNGLILSSEALL